MSFIFKTEVTPDEKKLLDKVKVIMRLHDVRGWADFVPQRPGGMFGTPEPHHPFMLVFKAPGKRRYKTVYYKSPENLLNGLERFIHRNDNPGT